VYALKNLDEKLNLVFFRGEKKQGEVSAVLGDRG